MSKIAFAVHGGAGIMTPYLRKNLKACEEGLREATNKGYQILQKGGSSMDAVEAGVRILEDNPLFNAGCGSALNCRGEVEMDASIMNGKNLKAGAVSMVRNVKNPISLARVVMHKTKHVLLSGYGALEMAQNAGILLETEAYFITEHQLREFYKLHKHETIQDIIEKKNYGTVGAVALDKRGNLAAGTSTGGTSNCLPGRIGDSCIIGAGCYANNNTCAVSGTGEGEFLVRGVIAHTISMMMEQEKSLEEACDYTIHHRSKLIHGEIGVIAIDRQGNISVSFNTKIMKRAWRSSGEKLVVQILR